MDTQASYKLPESKKATLRKTLLGTSLLFFGVSIFSFLNPDQVAQILNMDTDMVNIFSAALALIATSDFIVAFIIFKPKDHV